MVGLLAIEPEGGVEQVAGAFFQIVVEIGVAVVAVEEREDLLTLGHGADEGGVADFIEVVVRLGGGFETRAGEGGLPDLDGVVFLRLGIGSEEGELAIFEGGESVAVDGSFHALGDDVVGHQDVVAALAIVENVEKILAIRRLDPPLEQHVGVVAIEEAELAVAEVVAAGENHAVVVGQEDAALLDGVDAVDLIEFVVEDEVAVGLFLIGADLEEDQVAEGGVENLGVVEGLVGLLDGLAVDPGTAVGIILNLYR